MVTHVYFTVYNMYLRVYILWVYNISPLGLILLPWVKYYSLGFITPWVFSTNPLGLLFTWIFSINLLGIFTWVHIHGV